nr:DciA family protein [uncultured Halomonas sp.]
MSIKPKRFRAQPMTRLLAGNSSSPGDLGNLMRMARAIDRAQQYLREHLPQEVREHIFVGGYRQGKLTLITDRAVWMTWLRYEQTRLLQLLHQLPEFETVTGLIFKVRPVSPPKVPPRLTRGLSARAADEISCCAADVDDPMLKRSLERLATHAEANEDSSSPLK